jgi:hypothetical protein
MGSDVRISTDTSSGEKYAHNAPSLWQIEQLQLVSEEGIALKRRVIFPQWQVASIIQYAV